MNKRIIVAGSANTDIVLSLPKAIESGESLIARSQTVVAGGKGANRAVALQRLGASPLFACCLGNDGYGESLLSLYEGEGLDTSLISVREASTGTAYILLDNAGNNRIVVYPGANSLFGESETDSVIRLLGKTAFLSLELEIPPEAVEKLVHAAVKAQVPVIIDAAPIRDSLPAGIFKGAYVLSPNESEARQLTGIDIRSEKDVKQALRALYSYGVKYSLIKLGEKGSVCYDGTDYITCPAVNTGKPAEDTTAAGDCYMAALTKALSDGRNIEQAMHYASTAAGIAVTRRGAVPSLPTEKEVLEFL